MTDYDEGEGQGPEPAATDDVAALKAKLAEFEEDNFKLRDKIRRADFEKEYGNEIAELVPPGLSPDEAKDLAEKLSVRLKPEQQETQALEAAEEASPQGEQAPAGLKAVTGSPPANSHIAPGSDMTAKEIHELGKTDPVAAQVAMQAKYRAQ